MTDIEKLVQLRKEQEALINADLTTAAAEVRDVLVRSAALVEKLHRDLAQLREAQEALLQRNTALRLECEGAIAERDRWAARVKVLEARIAAARDVLDGAP